MKKFLACLLAALMFIATFTACKGKKTTSSDVDETYTSDLGIVTMDGEESEITDSDSMNDNNTSNKNSSNNNSNKNNNGGSQTTSTPITVDHGDKKGYFLNDLNNTGKKATVKNNCFSTGYPIAEKTVTLDVMIKDYTNMAKYDAMKINDFFKEKMNIKINWNVVQENNVISKVTLALSSGNMPDLFLGMQPYDQIGTYGTQGLLVDFNKYMDYAPNLQRMFKEIPETKFAVTAENGAIYSTPMYNGDRDPFAYEGLYINKTWLNKLNLSMPTNTSAFMKVLNAFKNNDPNGNGKQDEVPLYLVGNNMAGVLPACLYGPFGIAAYGGFVGYSINDSGKVQANYITTNYKTALTYYKTLYKNGLIDSNWLNNSENTLKNALNSNTTIVGAFVSHQPLSLMDANKFSNYTLVPAFRDKSVSKPTWSITNVENIWKGWAMISSSCKYPEVAVRMVDYFYSLEGTLTSQYGPQGYNWDVKKDGTIYMKDDYYKGTYSWVELTPQYSLPHYASDVYLKLIDRTKSDLVPENTMASLKAAKDIKSTYLKVTPKNVYPNLAGYGRKSDYDGIKIPSDQLQTYVQTMAIEFVTGKSDIGAFWDNYVSVCKSLGCDQSVAIKQKAYDRYVSAVK